jgi:uroporphyrinogen-III decarboxylase
MGLFANLFRGNLGVEAGRSASNQGVFLSGGPAHVIEEAKACLEAWGNGPGYILTVGCDFLKEVLLENVQALLSMKKVGVV